jgi:acetylornithine deacetylase/succinyl-diaminopimelate desuccinylase-like protein
MSEVTELVRELVAIGSVNPDLVPGGAGEQAIARFVAEWLERAGLEVSVDEVALGRPYGTAIARGCGTGPTLLFNAHMDTVGAGEMKNPHEPPRSTGRWVRALIAVASASSD